MTKIDSRVAEHAAAMLRGADWLRWAVVCALILLGGGPVAAHEGDSHAGGILVGSPEILLLGYCVLIGLAAVLGGIIPQYVHLNHVQMQMALSAVGGLILGIAVLHLWPHAVHELGIDQVDRVATWTLGGMLATFLLLRWFHFHQHGETHPCVEDHVCGDPHEHSHAPHHAPLDAANATRSLPILSASPAAQSLAIQRKQDWTWLGTAIGLAIHTISDGAALAAAVASGTGQVGWPGAGVFLAIALHKPLDTLSVGMLMKAAGWNLGLRIIVIALLAFACPVGAMLFWNFASLDLANGSTITGCALAASAGVFLCIALGDLLPEMEFHSHNRWLLTLLLMLGITVAWLLKFVEPSHAH